MTLRSRSFALKLPTAILATAVALGACRGQRPGDGSPPAAPTTAQQERTANPLPNLEPGPYPPGSRFALDPLWIRAQKGDPLDLSRLARREGAAGLFEGFLQGGGAALTALGALPYAPDARVALDRLCAYLSTGQPASLEPVLVAIQGALARPAGDREAFDPEALASCRRALEGFAARPGLSAKAVDLAASGRQLLAEQGY